MTRDRDVLDTPAAGPLVIRGSILRVLGYAAGSVLSLAAVALLTRYLGPADFGRYGTVFALVTIVAAVTDVGMTTLAVREYATRRGADRDRLMRDLMGLRMALTGLGTLLAVGFALAAGYDGEMVAGAAAAGVGLMATVYADTLRVPLQAQLQLGRVSALELLRQGATAALLVGGIVAGVGIVPLLGVPFPVALLLLAVTAALVAGRIPLSPSLHPRAWAALLRETAAFALATAVGTLYAYMAVVVLSLVASDAEVGYFNASFRVFLVVVAMAGLAVASAFPVFARAAVEDEPRLAYGADRLFRVAALLGALVAVVCALGAPAIVAVVAGEEEFAAAIGVLRVQAAAMFPSFLLLTWGHVLISLRLHRALLVANAIALSVSLALAVALGSAYGALGAAWASLAGETVLAVAYGIALALARPALRPDVAVLARIALAAAPAAALVLIPGLPSVLLAAAAAAVFGAIALAVRAVPGELLELIPRRRAR